MLPVLGQMPQRELAEAAGLSVRRLRDVLGEMARPREQTRAVLTCPALARARDYDVSVCRHPRLGYYDFWTKTTDSSRGAMSWR